MMSQENVSRKDLLTANLPGQFVSKVGIKEVCIPAGGRAAYHSHPCPVVGYVASGTLLFQAEGGEPEVLKTGSAFYEPKNLPVVHFDNASATEPLVFIAFYLLEGTEQLITLLKPG